MNEQTTSECLLTFEPGAHAARRREAVALLKLAADRLSSAASALEAAAAVPPVVQGSQGAGRAVTPNSRRLLLHWGMAASGIACRLAEAVEEVEHG